MKTKSIHQINVQFCNLVCMAANSNAPKTNRVSRMRLIGAIAERYRQNIVKQLNAMGVYNTPNFSKIGISFGIYTK